jgi:hypothetical protein
VGNAKYNLEDLVALYERNILKYLTKIAEEGN